MSMLDSVKVISFEITHKEDGRMVSLAMKRISEFTDAQETSGEFEYETKLRQDKFKELVASNPEGWKQDFNNNESWQLVACKLFKSGKLYAQQVRGEKLEEITEDDLAAMAWSAEAEKEAQEIEERARASLLKEAAEVLLDEPVRIVRRIHDS